MKKNIIYLLSSVFSILLVQCAEPNLPQLIRQHFQPCSEGVASTQEEKLEYDYTGGVLSLHYQMIVNCGISGATATFCMEDKDIIIDIYLEGVNNANCMCSPTISLTMQDIMRGTYNITINKLQKSSSGDYVERNSYLDTITL